MNSISIIINYYTYTVTSKANAALSQMPLNILGFNKLAKPGVFGKAFTLLSKLKPLCHNCFKTETIATKLIFIKT